MSSPTLRAVAFGLLLGFAVAAIVLCGLTLFADPAPGPPIVIPTTYGPPSTGAVP